MDVATSAPKAAGGDGTDRAETSDRGEPPVAPVVAVVVTCDPGWWLEDCLSSLAEQDYPQLSVLIVDADSAEDPTPRIAAVMPSAYVRRTRRRRGFGTAANEVLGIVEGASHYLFCHDDVVLSPHAVRLMVEEALRSNAGVVAPKLVGWFQTDRLLAVGMGADTFGLPVPLAERGELDQEQHDITRDVFFAPAPCSLIRADLFASLGGFDPGYGTVGEDLDLSWRAHLAGARVVSAPAASVAHLEATEGGERSVDGHLLSTGPQAAARPIVPERLVSGGPALDSEPWDEELPEGADTAVGRHATWRARRVAQRDYEHEEWSTGGEWDEDWEPTRRRRRRQRSGGASGSTGAAAAGATAAGATGAGATAAGATAAGATSTGGGEVVDPQAQELSDRRTAARLRAVATNDSPLRVLTHLPALFLLALGQAGVLVARRDRNAARRVMRPWATLLTQSGGISKRRRLARKARTVPDPEVTALRSRRPIRLRDTLQPVASSGHPAGPDPDRRVTLSVWIAVLAVQAFGSRHLLVGHLPTIGELGRWPALHTLAGQATSGWRLTGLGVAGPAPTAFGLLAVAGLLFLGHMALLQHVLVLGLLPLGTIGMARLARPFGSRRAQMVGVAAYAVVPLSFNALARGHWSGLVAYAAFPWIVSRLARASGLSPFTRPEGPAWRPVVALALIIALASAVQPGILPLVLLVGIAFAIAAAATGAASAGVRALRLAVSSAVGALILLLPWAESWIPPGGEWAIFTGASSDGHHAAHLATLLHFDTGPVGAGPLGYALLVTAALPVIIGREWRLTWAVRLWVVFVAAVGLAWAGQHGALGAVWPGSEVMLAPAAVAIALAAALAMAAFDADLRGSTFGWRQAVAGFAAAAALLACLPVLVATADGRWRQRRAGFDELLSWMADQRAKGDFRVLWVGSPDVLPIAGWQDVTGLAYATSINGPPDLSDRWPGTSVGTTGLLGQAIELVRRGDTTAVGHLLAPMGVRYLVVVESPAPLTNPTADYRPVPRDLPAGLDSQLDLRLIDQSKSATVYENDAWVPMRAAIPDRVVPAAELDDPRVARIADLGPAPPVLPAGGPTGFAGPVPTGSAIEVAQARSGHWQLTVGGHSVERRPVWGSANLFSVGPGAVARLRYNTPVGWRLAYLLMAGLWIAAVAAVVRRA